MKIIVTAVVDLDETVWREAYGSQDSAKEIRELVKGDTQEVLAQDFANRGLVAKVVVR